MSTSNVWQFFSLLLFRFIIYWRLQIWKLRRLQRKELAQEYLLSRDTGCPYLECNKQESQNNCRSWNKLIALNLLLHNRVFYYFEHWIGIAKHQITLKLKLQSLKYFIMLDHELKIQIAIVFNKTINFLIPGWTRFRANDCASAGGLDAIHRSLSRAKTNEKKSRLRFLQGPLFRAQYSASVYYPLLAKSGLTFIRVW